MRLVGLGTPVRGIEAGVVSWQGSVKDKDLTAPPGSPSTGDRYIVASPATGAWTGHEDDIATWDGGSWDFETPLPGWVVWVIDVAELYIYDGSAWNQESFGPHAATHEDGGSDEVPVENLPTAGGAGTVVTGDGAGGLVMAMPGTPGSHKATHENGGIDEISVAGLSGLLADAQTTLAHVLDGAKHTVSGLTPGDILTALTATTFGFQAPDGGGVVEKAIDHTWEGDDAANRVIDLGDNYQFIIVFQEEAAIEDASRPVYAIAFGTYYSLLFNSSAGYTQHRCMSSSDIWWQGKMFGGDANKIKCGSVAGQATGTNKSGKTYRLIGFKFSSME